MPCYERSVNVARLKSDLKTHTKRILFYDPYRTPIFDKTMHHTYMISSGFCAGSAPDSELWHFLPNVPQFGERAAFSWQKVPLSLDCGALQDSVLWHGHQNVAHKVVENRHTWRHVFKGRRGALVAFSLTYTVHIQ